MVQMSWILAKVCISDSYIRFLKEIWKFFKIGWFLADKRQFLHFSRFDFGTAFSTENVKTPSNPLQFTWFLLYSFLIMPATKVRIGFWKFWIFTELWPNLWIKMAFLCKKWPNLTKICPFDPQNRGALIWLKSMMAD